MLLEIAKQFGGAMLSVRSSLIIAVLFVAGCGELPDQAATVTQEQGEELTALLTGLARESNATLAFCETAQDTRACDAESEGLKAAGVGGLLLPLNATLTGMTIVEGEADFDLTINGIGAACAKAPLMFEEAQRTLSARGFYCNWAGIGNVLATVELTADWTNDPEADFGGRYLIRFNGTGNGSGSGVYRARIQ
ncbi:MAG: hypothetical protein AAFV87_03235 [Pseudomonadota bacterium]